MASETICGWVLSDMLGDEKFGDSPTHTLKCTVDSTDDLRDDLRKFWEIENI